MNTRTLSYGIAVVLLISGAVYLATKDASSPQSIGSGTYCSSDGTLVDTMPIQSHRSCCLKTDHSGKTYAVTTPSEYSFSIVDDQGATLKELAVTHTKLMHIIAVRKDLAYFQHLHPEFDESTGTFTLTGLQFPEPGNYRIFADFAPSGGQKDPKGNPLIVTLSEDVTAGTSYTPIPIGSEENVKTYGSYRASLTTHGGPVSDTEGMLTFSLSQGGKPVTDLEPYLGALGHSVVLREGTLDFIHAHPVASTTQNGTVSFIVYFPRDGKYKIFSQFQHNATVLTTDFVVSVAPGAESGSLQNADPQVIPSMNHNVH